MFPYHDGHLFMITPGDTDSFEIHTTKMCIRDRFLTDPTGNRRFLPFEVLHIDKPTAESINIDNFYSEIMYLYRQGKSNKMDQKRNRYFMETNSD